LTFSQNRIELPIKDSVIHFEKIGELVKEKGDCSKDILYSSAKSWVAKVFNDATNVIKMDDKEAGRLIVKYISNLETVYYQGRYEIVYVNYTMQIDIKDCKYRIALREPIMSSVIPMLNPNMSSTYFYYIQGISPKSLRAFMEGETAWFKRYDGYYKKLQSDAESIFSNFEVSINKEIKKDDW
jgi:hypothetical protein